MNDNQYTEQNISQLLQRAKSAPELSDIAKQRIWQAMRAKQKRQLVRRTFSRVLVAIAAAVLAVAGVNWFLSSPKPSTKRLLESDTNRYALQDGSSLIIHQGEYTEDKTLRSITMLRGAALIDAKAGASPLIVHTPQGKVSLNEGRFLIDLRKEETQVIAIKGNLAIDAKQVKGELKTGEAADFSSRGITRRPMPRVGTLAYWAKPWLAEETLALLQTPDLMISQRPERPETAKPLPLRNFTVDVYIEDLMARVAIDQTFFNDDTLNREARYTFPLPANAAISRLAMYVDGSLMEAGIVTKDQGRNIYETVVHQSKDPALLEQLQGNLFQTRIFPLLPRQEKRILLSYTQPLQQVFDGYQVAIPIPNRKAPSDRVRYQVKIKDGAMLAISSPSHAIWVEAEGNDAIVSFEASQYLLQRDFLLQVQGLSEVSYTRAYTDKTTRIWSASFAPKLPIESTFAQRHWVFLHDVSASRSELLRSAQAYLIERFLVEVDPNDTFSVIAFDSSARTFSKEPMLVKDRDQKALAKFLREQEGVGVTNIESALGLTLPSPNFGEGGPSATPMVGEGRGEGEVQIVYLGDGELGLDAEPRVEKLKAMMAGKAKFIGIAVGDPYNESNLRALSDATGGVFTSINPTEDMSWRIFDLVSLFNTTRLTNATVKLFDANNQELSALSYLSSSSISAGDAVTVAASTRQNPAFLVLEGELNGQAWSQRIALEAPKEDTAYLPRLWAQWRIRALIQEGQSKNEKEITQLAMDNFLVSPFTSLLVLENDAMYAQYKVNRGSETDWARYDAPKKIEVRAELVASVDKSKETWFPGQAQDDSFLRFKNPEEEEFGKQGEAPDLADEDMDKVRRLIRESLGLRANDQLPRLQFPSFEDRWATLTTLTTTTEERGGWGPVLQLDGKDLLSRGTFQGFRGDGFGAGFLLASDIDGDGQNDATLRDLSGAVFVRNFLDPTEIDPNREFQDLRGKVTFLQNYDSLPGDSFYSPELGRFIYLEGLDLGVNAKNDRGEVYWSPEEMNKLLDPLEYVPGLFATGFDLEKQLLSSESAKRSGSIDKGAKALLQKAKRSTGLELTSEDGVRLSVNPNGTFQLQRVLESSLGEEILFNGKTLYHLYRELGVLTKRDAKKLAPLVLWTYAPFVVPSADALSAKFLVTLSGTDTIQVKDPGSKELIAEMVFNEQSQLIKLRRFFAGEPSQELSFAYTDDSLTVSVGEKTITYQVAETVPSSVSVDEPFWSTFELPVHADTYWHERRSRASKEEMPYLTRQLLLTYWSQPGLIGNNNSWLDELEREGDLSSGDLLFASPQSLERFGFTQDKNAEFINARYFDMTYKYLSFAEKHPNSLLGMLAMYRGIVQRDMSESLAEEYNDKTLELLGSFIREYPESPLRFLLISNYSSSIEQEFIPEVAALWGELSQQKSAAQLALLQEIQLLSRCSIESDCYQEFLLQVDVLLNEFVVRGGAPVLTNQIRSSLEQTAEGKEKLAQLWQRWEQDAFEAEDPSLLFGLIEQASKELLPEVVGRIKSERSGSSGVLWGASVLLENRGESFLALELLAVEVKNGSIPALYWSSRLQANTGDFFSAASSLSRWLILVKEKLPSAKAKRFYLKLFELYLAQDVKKQERAVAGGARETKEEREAFLSEAIHAANAARGIGADQQIDLILYEWLKETKKSEALRYLYSIIEREPMNAQAYGVVYEKLQQNQSLEEAASVLALAARVESTNPEWLFKQAQSLCSLHKKREVISVLDAILDGNWQERFLDFVRQSNEMKMQLEQGTLSCE